MGTWKVSGGSNAQQLTSRRAGESGFLLVSLTLWGFATHPTAEQWGCGRRISTFLKSWQAFHPRLGLESWLAARPSNPDSRL